MKIFYLKSIRVLNIWDSDNANMLNGTDGTMFAPFVNRDQKIYTFNSDMCR